MSTGRSFSVWFTSADRQKLEEAAALAGCRSLSKYIRDRTLDRGGARGDHVDEWAELQEVTGRLTEIERSQQSVQALLAMLLVLVCKKATTREHTELVLACNDAYMPIDILASSLPDLAALLTRFTEDLP